ncbi:short-chain dehydrogenase/reductase family 16C member 6-like isoform X2 [Argiope bruennichi]|uniref:short-chain dehydrogenase/reductase family 16C member 6-like isoform X2 n=1 Tax=Argiope bruennichi TaxID=94029 RepID=UPI0024959DB9|nr:short-chain dehydrogenase/reductase family 16C member 6-like isoform X2 [Argiope bruennichi]
MSVVKFLTNLVLLIYYILESVVLTFVPRSLRYKDIKGQTVLITGGGSGIGRLLAIRFAKRGARIVVWDLNLNGAQETAKLVKDQGGEAFAFHCDVSQPQAVYDAAAKVKQEVGKVDILVNNAGIVTGKRFLECPDEKIKKTFEVNALAHFWTCKAFLPDMMAANMGHIVSIASLAGHTGAVRLTDYCASKFAAVGFEESLRLELHVEGYNGIKSSVVCPYFINTGMFDGVEAGLFAMLTPEYVADQIVSAVLANQEVIIIPGYFSVLVALKAMLPSKLIYIMNSLFSLESAMDGFTGRQKQD